MTTLENIKSARQLRTYVNVNTSQFPVLITAHGDGTVSGLLLTNMCKLVPVSLLGGTRVSKSGACYRKALDYLRKHHPEVKGFSRVPLKRATKLVRSLENKA